MEEPIAYLNGRILPGSSLSISPTDAGFVLGATVAEQLRTFAGKVFRWEDHLARLHHSLQIVGVDPGVTDGELRSAAGELIAHNRALLEPGDDLGLSIFVTPGSYPAYATPGESRPVVAMHTYPLPFRLWADKYETGQSLVSTDVPQVSPHCWPPGLKCRSRMHYHLADRRAAEIEPGARALLLDAEGYVTEASTANLAIYRAAEGIVSPPTAKVLHGISLAEVVELAAGLGIAAGERELRIEDVASADEALLTSTPSCLVPVTHLNGRPIGDGRPGPVFRQLLASWGEHVGLDIAGQARRFQGR